MTNCQPRKATGAPKACPNLAYRYLLSIAPTGVGFLLQITLGAQQWTA